MKLFALALILAPMFAEANVVTDLPYQCSATESQRGGECWGKRSSREDWARSSALEACRQQALDPGDCTVLECNFHMPDQPQDPQPIPQPEPQPAPAPDDSAFCFNTVQCAGEAVCVRSRCVDPQGAENACADDNDCGAPTRCRDGRCGY